MNTQTEQIATVETPPSKTWSQSLGTMFPYISPEFVPMLLLVSIGGFAIQIYKAVSHSGWYGVFSNPYSVAWSFVWFVVCCGIYTKLIAPHMERTHQNLGMLIHVSCIYTFFAGTLVCVQFVIRTIH